MKKIATLFALACIGYAPVAQAQVIFSENFESTVGTALPAGWTETNVGATTWKTGTNTTLQSQYFPIEAHTRMVGFNDDAAGQTAANTNQLLKTPSINLSTATAPALSFDLFYYAGTYQNVAETLTVEISTNGGTNWTVLQTVAGNGNAIWPTKYISLAAYAGQSNVMIGFRYRDGGQWLFGAMFDNITVFNQSANDVGITNANFPKIAVNNTALTADIMNVGTANITTVDLEYSVDGGTPVTQTFGSLNLAPFATTTLTFTTNVQGFSTTSSHSIVVTATSVNGGVDGNTANNVDSVSFAPATQTVQRNGLIEEFSSSTCPPCASFNAVFDPLALAQNANIPSSNFNVIKYQMNWPGAGNDASYNSFGATRRAYYGVSGIPDHYTNGATGGAGDAAEIAASKTAPAFMSIAGTYQIDQTNQTSGNLLVNVTVTPYFTLADNFTVHIASVERYYQNSANTTGQLDYRYIMRKMFPNGSGTAVASFTAGTPQTFTFNNNPYVVGGVTQSNSNFWWQPIATDLVVFVQNETTGEVYQSQSIPATWPTNVSNIANDTKVVVFPNPATDHAVVALNMENAASVNINVTDALGRVVFTNSQNLAAGRHDVVINTNDFAAGLYNVTIQTERGTITERLSVVK